MIEKIIGVYTRARVAQSETFLVAYRRLGAAPFKEALYGPPKQRTKVEKVTEEV